MSAFRLVLMTGLMLLISSAAQAGPIMDWLCGCTPNMTTATTYAPAYVPPAVQTVPVATAQQTTYYAPVVAAPMPVTAYRVLPVVPRPTTTYYGSTRYNPYSAAPVTVYRPVVPVAPVVTTTRLIPYTSYRMVYPTAVTYYGVAPAAVVYPAPAACPLPIAQPVPVAQPAPYDYGSPASGYAPLTAGGASDDASLIPPSLPPSQPTTSNYPILQSPVQQTEQPASPIVVEKPADSTSGTTRLDYKLIPPPSATPAPPKEEPKPAPQGEQKSSGQEAKPEKSSSPPIIQHDSIMNPAGGENRDRTTRLPVRLVSREKPVAAEPAVRVLSGDIWCPVKD